MAQPKKSWMEEHQFMVIGAMTLLLYIIFLATFHILSNAPVEEVHASYVAVIHLLPLIAACLIGYDLYIHKEKS